MLTRSHAITGGISSIAQAGAYVSASLAAMALPLEKFADTAEFVAFHAAHPAPLTVLALSLIALAVLGVGVVVPVTGMLLGADKNGWVAFGRNLAFLSLVVIAAYYTWFLVGLSDFVSAYQSGDAATRQALALMDPHVPMNWVTWFIFGGMGLWVAIVAAAVLRQGALPRAFVLACVLKTGGFWLALAGVTIGNVPLAIAGTGVGALVGGTFYHLWLGIELLRLARRIE